MNYNINKADDGYKLRKWFLRNFPNIPIPKLAKLIRTRKILCNEQKVSLNSVLLENSILTIPDEFEVEKKFSKTIKKSINPTDEKLIKSCIIYEDENILAFNKPNNLSVQKETKHTKSMIDIINKIWPEARIVHRLDKGTTGTTVFAKTRNSAEALSNQFAKNTVNKEYIAIVQNQLPLENKIIDMPIKYICEKTKKVSLKSAQTNFEVITKGLFKNVNVAVIKAQPKEGRKHQVRVHCALGLSAAVIGDKKYSSSNTSCLSKSLLMLHCHKIVVNTGKEKKILISPLPEHILAFIDKITNQTPPVSRTFLVN